MRATFLCLAAVLAAGISACPAFAQVIWQSRALCRPLGVAPDMCGPGFFVTDVQGNTFGPSYYVYPPFPPERGIGPGSFKYCFVTPYGVVCQPGLPPPQAFPQLPKGPPTVAFPTHPYARSPRDFFMWVEAVEDEISRLRHPALIP